MAANPSNSASARAAAARILQGWLDSGRSPERAIEEQDSGHGAVLELVYGVVRWRRSLDWIMRRLVPRPPPLSLRAHLLTGLYELFYADHAPHAVVNETVDAAKARLGVRRAGLVNAALRRAVREQEELRRALEQQSDGVRWSHPDILLERWRKQTGRIEVERLCEWNNTPPPVCVRIRTERVSLESVLQAWRAADVQVALHPIRPADFAILPRGVRVSELPGYAEGWFAIQDPATLLAVDVLAPQPGERILDACAAPGGKTLAVADRLSGRGTVAALDVDEARLRWLRDNARRLGAERVKVVHGDVRNPTAAARRLLRSVAPDGFDAVLLDVPCTSTGAIRRRPDVRWRFSLRRLSTLTRLQRELLTSATSWLKPRGRLVYSTCSLEPEENEELVAGWLKAHPDFILRKECRRVPPQSGTDGAYAARLERRSKESAEA